jgi:hypothetical protein
MGHQRRIKEQRRRERAAHDKRVQPAEARDLALGYWAVAYLDILGYRSALWEMNKRPPLPPHGSQEETTLRDAAARAVKIRRDIVGIMDGFMNSAMSPNGPLPDALPPQWHETALAWRQFKVGNARFSDSLFLYSPLAPSPTHALPIRAVYTMMLACSSTMLFQLARGSPDYRDTLPLRGALDTNVGVECADRPREGSPGPAPLQLYSAAMATAYQMETTVADWPRLLVSDAFLEMVHFYAAAAGNDPHARMTREIGKKCREFLFQDTDGLWAVDYLGEGVHRLPSGPDLRPFVKGAHDFACAARAAHAAKGDAKLVAKYEHLEHYIASRLSLWQ